VIKYQRPNSFKQLAKLLFVSLFILCSKNINAAIDDYFYYDIRPTSSNYGNTGLLELPSARFMPQASLRLTFSSSFPNEYTALTASPFPWLEATYRYTEVKDRLYGPITYSGNQSFKDKAFDLHIKLFNERYIIPQIALGLRDFAGTGKLSSEYIVSTKSIGNFDVTLGLGWGLLGTEGGISNPFNSIRDSFKERSSFSGQGGEVNFSNWFSGDTSLFAGLEYDLNSLGLRLKLEYDTSNPDINAGLNVDSRFNIGLNYYLSNNLNFGLAFERGNQFRLSFALKGDFSKDTILKKPPERVVSLSPLQKRRAFSEKDIFYRSLNKNIREEGIYLQGATYTKNQIHVVIADKKYSSTPRSSGRVARIASALAADEVEEIIINKMNGDLEVSSISFDRKELDQANKNKLTYIELLESSKLSSNSADPLYKRSEFKPTLNLPQIDWNMSPALRHQIGGPEAFYLGQLWWKTDINIKFARNLTLHSSFGIDLYNNFDEFANPSFSEIPHVRSDIQEYLREGENNVQRMLLQYLHSPLKDVFVKADLGLLEEMFGGMGGEILYRPFDKNYALGLTLYKVKQREYRQRFGFRDYETETGHLGIYYDFPYGISSRLQVGKYLAKDKGASIDLSRTFDTGFTVGFFATFTDLSAEEFGEGTFDKGFYFSIPTELFYTDYRVGHIAFGLHPLTKDGGSFLSLYNSLYGVLGGTNKDYLLRDWEDVLN